ncbi:pentapeptide repeat-containing protein [Planobispora rosea]|uniref:pentapeptide repeat-containing protein n=1 Tax=Planobispora rosea TaxID=35762 RepID=UPI00083B59FD|nr:pentapeptide repeat-containing protein [Planobispora rosea]
MAKPDETVPTPPDKPPASGEGLRLARIGPVLTLALTGAVLLSVGLFVGALWLLGFPDLTPVGPKGISLARMLDLLKLSFAVVAGIGGVIALVVAYRKQKVTEAAGHRQQAAELRADEAHQREATKLFNERFATAAGQLGHDAPAVRLTGVHALAGLADDAPTRELRQTMIDVLCAYLRIPYAPDPGEEGGRDERLAFAGLREVRHTIIRIITHLRDGASTSWQGHDFDFTGVVFDGGDFARAEFSGGEVSFDGAKFSGGTVDFRHVSNWSHPPTLPGPAPAGLLLPKLTATAGKSEAPAPEAEETAE